MKLKNLLITQGLLVIVSFFNFLFAILVAQNLIAILLSSCVFFYILFSFYTMVKDYYYD